MEKIPEGAGQGWGEVKEALLVYVMSVGEGTQPALKTSIACSQRLFAHS